MPMEINPTMHYSISNNQEQQHARHANLGYGSNTSTTHCITIKHCVVKELGKICNFFYRNFSCSTTAQMGHRPPHFEVPVSHTIRHTHLAGLLWM